MILHLGVIDIPYVSGPIAPRRVAVRRRKGDLVPQAVSLPSAGQETTGDVADILEDEYHIMETFFEVHQGDIVHALEEAIGGSLENLLLGAPAGNNSLAAAESEIAMLFKKFLSGKEMDRLGVPGVPTQAALRGVSHRFKHPYAKRAARPSFIDTGTYQANFRAWIED